MTSGEFRDLFLPNLGLIMFAGIELISLVTDAIPITDFANNFEKSCALNFDTNDPGIANVFSSLLEIKGGSPLYSAQNETARASIAEKLFDIELFGSPEEREMLSKIQAFVRAYLYADQTNQPFDYNSNAAIDLVRFNLFGIYVAAELIKSKDSIPYFITNSGRSIAQTLTNERMHYYVGPIFGDIRADFEFAISILDFIDCHIKCPIH